MNIDVIYVSGVYLSCFGHVLLKNIGYELSEFI